MKRKPMSRKQSKGVWRRNAGKHHAKNDKKRKFEDRGGPLY